MHSCPHLPRDSLLSLMYGTAAQLADSIKAQMVPCQLTSQAQLQLVARHCCRWCKGHGIKPLLGLLASGRSSTRAHAAMWVGLWSRIHCTRVERDGGSRFQSSQDDRLAWFIRAHEGLLDALEHSQHARVRKASVAAAAYAQVAKVGSAILPLFTTLVAQFTQILSDGVVAYLHPWIGRVMTSCTRIHLAYIMQP